jgi:uncharacterized membrane protein YidH (DUF202 family)
MSAARIVGIILIVGGLAAFVFGGVSWTENKTIVDIGPIQATAKERKSLPIPAVVSGIAVIAGIVLLVMPARRR